MPGWEKTWRTNDNFSTRLKEVEDFMLMVCKSHGMTSNTFNRYRKGARAALLVDVPFSLGANFTLDELRKVKEGADPTVIRRARKQRTAERAASKKATVLPLPNDNADPAEFLDGIGGRLAQFLFQIKVKMGPSGHKKLVGILRKLCRPE